MVQDILHNLCGIARNSRVGVRLNIPEHRYPTAPRQKPRQHDQALPVGWAEVYRTLLPDCPNQRVSAFNFMTYVAGCLEYKAMMRIRMVAELMALLDDAATEVEMIHQGRAHREKRRVNIGVGKNVEHRVGVHGQWTIVQSEGDDRVLRIDPRHQVPEELI